MQAGAAELLLVYIGFHVYYSDIDHRLENKSMVGVYVMDLLGVCVMDLLATALHVMSRNHSNHSAFHLL